MKRSKSLWTAAILMLVLLLVSASGCKCSGSKSKESQTETRESQADEAPAEDTAAEEEENTDAAVSKADRAMLEMANNNIQARYNQMAFDDEYIYFNVSGRGTCRCRYDGSDVQCFEKKLENAVIADGKLWGYWYDSDAPEAAGLYSMDLKTGDMTQIIELPNKEDSITSILVSGNWLCYVGKGGTVLNVRDLTTGEEKTISEWAAPEYSAENENRTADIPMCIYGNTLYAMIYTAPKDYKWSVCSYELGSNADMVTDAAVFTYTPSPRAWVWMENGLLIPGSEQYYYAEWSDIEDGNLAFRNEENIIGTKFSEGGDFWNMSSDNYNTIRYVLGNDLMFIQYGGVQYYKDFDFEEQQKIQELSQDALSSPHGIHDGALYIYTSGYYSEILKISEGGTVERIPVTLPEEP